MAQLQTSSHASSHERPDLLSRLEYGVFWCAQRWRTGLAVVVGLVVGVIGYGWWQTQQQERAQAASRALAAATTTSPPDRSALEQLVTQYAGTFAERHARFLLAQQALRDTQPEAARGWIEPLVTGNTADPFTRMGARALLAATYEAQGDWANAAKWFQEALQDPTATDREALLSNAVRNLVQAGQRDAARALLDRNGNDPARPLQAARETESLWLAIEHPTPTTQP